MSQDQPKDAKLRLFRQSLLSGWGELEHDAFSVSALCGARAALRVESGAVFADLLFEVPPSADRKPRSLDIALDGRPVVRHRLAAGNHLVQVRCAGAERIDLAWDGKDPERQAEPGAAPSARLMQLVFVHPGMGVEEYFSASFGYMDSRPDQKAGVVSTHTGKWREGAMLLEKATALLGRPPRRALDCGLGMGGAAIALARSGTAVVGLDYSLWYLEMARVHAFLLSTPLSALRADAQSMCFRDGAFDLVLLLDILEHVPRPDLMFREIARVLSPDGVLIFRNQYALRPDVLRRDPHYGVPLVVLLPRFLRRWIVVDRLKRAPELEDFKWFKTFGGLRRFARRNGIEVAPLDPSLTRDFRAAARAEKGFKGLVKRVAHALLSDAILENILVTLHDVYCVGRPAGRL